MRLTNLVYTAVLGLSAIACALPEAPHLVYAREVGTPLTERPPHYNRLDAREPKKGRKKGKGKKKGKVL